jgi:hypothetical protein
VAEIARRQAEEAAGDGVDEALAIIRTCGLTLLRMRRTLVGQEGWRGNPLEEATLVYAGSVQPAFGFIPIRGFARTVNRS